MPATAAPARTLHRTLADPAATARLAQRIAPLLGRGDVIALEGGLGVGKTTFARALIAALGGGEEVPSPTFTLVQVYALARFTLWHFDLFRLNRAEEVHELGIEDALGEGVSLIEWPARMAALLPRDRLDLALDLIAGAPSARALVLTGHGSWAARIADLDADD